MRSKTLHGLIILAALGLMWTRSTISPPSNSIRVICEIGGRVSSIHVKPGDHVHAGDVLIEMDTSDFELKKRSLESRIHFAEMGTFQADLPTLYRELAQLSLDLTQQTITSPTDGQIVSVTRLRAGTIIVTLVEEAKRLH